jgi:hypothetical protein
MELEDEISEWSFEIRYDTGRFVPSRRHVEVAQRQAPQNMGLGGWIGLPELKSILGSPNLATPETRPPLRAISSAL